MPTPRRNKEVFDDASRLTRQLIDALEGFEALRRQSVAGDYGANLTAPADGPTVAQVMAVVNTSAPAIRKYIDENHHMTNLVALL